jgi:hypothetical protein
VRDLFFLLCVRHRASLKESDFDQILLQDGFDSNALRPVSFSPPSTVSRGNVRQAFAEAQKMHPAIDAGLLASWIASGRPGRVWASALNALLRRAVTEGAAGGREPTQYLVFLALRALAKETYATLRDVPVQAAQRLLHGAVATGLFIAVRLAAREAGAFEGPAGALAEAATQPLCWMGGLRYLAGGGNTAYGIPIIDPLPRIDVFAQKVMQGASAEQLANDVKADLDSEDSFRRAERAYALSVVRAHLWQLLRLSETARTSAFSLEPLSPPQLFAAPGALERVLASPERRKEMHAQAKKAGKGMSHDEARAILESLARIAKEWGDDGSGVFPEDDVRETASRALTALAIDAALERLLDQAEIAVAHRSGQESVDGIEAEYEHGRLYFIGGEERPLIKSRAKAAQMGHLFCDVKDFTRRTAFLKEAVVADFLSREFYTPILTAAARHYQGAGHLNDRGGIYLNNLLGDAVSFSGDVVALVELAQDIRRALNSYSQRLEAESSSEVVARSIAAIDERTAARRAQLQQQLAETKAAIRARSRDSSGEDPQVRMSRIQAELSRLDDERNSEIALAAGEKLEAGIFISYGAAPEVATFEDHVFGAIKVAIAEKINESARGTARNGGVRSRLDALVRQERATRNNADLSCPFLVAVSQPLSIPVPADAEAAIMGCLSGGDANMAELLLQRSVRQFIANLGRGRGDATGDIYNGGAALSEEALRAYVTARDGELLFLSRRVSVSALHASIVERFVFPMDTLQLVAAVEPGAQALQELYVHVGRALFKGFEKTGGLGVYEVIPPGSPLFSLLAQHHLPRWLVEHEHGRSDGPRSSAAGS